MTAQPSEKQDRQKTDGLNTWIFLLVWAEAYGLPFYLYFIPFAVLGGLLGEHRKFVYNEAPQVLEPPYDPNIKRGVNTPLITVCITLAWTLLTIIPHHYCGIAKRPWWLILAVVKFGVVAGLVSAFVFQTKYLPLPLGSCTDFGVWRDSTGVPDGTPTLWELLPVKKGKNSISTGCDEFVGLWRWEIAMAFLVSVSGVGAALIFAYFHRLSILKPPASADFISRLFAPPVRYTFSGRRYPKGQSESDQETSSVELLKNNESLESGRMTRPVFDGTSDAPQQCSCPDVERQPCWACGVPVCWDCKIKASLPAPSHRHKFRCDRCFYRSCCKTKLNHSWFSPIRCTCGGTDTSAGRKWFMNLDLCRAHCSKLDDEAVYALRQAKERLGQHEELTLTSARCGDCDAARPLNKEHWRCCAPCGAFDPGGYCQDRA